MLAIDDMKKLARMQEKLLERSFDDREANLEKYKNTVIQIDEYTFSELLSDLSQLDEHNQTLEDELPFLEQVKSSYDQLLEQQLSFKRVCDLYGDANLELSDLSQINIEYIENRINVINGYLINVKNIDNNKIKLQELNDKLVVEEKNKTFLNKELLEYEKLLRNNFVSAEGRYIVDGQLQYVSVVLEYDKLGYDFNQLLEDSQNLNELLSVVNNEKIEVEEKLKTAEICFNSIPNSESKQILDEINKEYVKIRYRLSMLKILELLSKNYDDYDLFKEKREKILDLIKYRMTCTEKLGIRVSIDPFSRTKVMEQLDMVISMTDNSKNINKIKKDIASLSERVEDMISQNDIYMSQINTIEDLIVNNTSISDIDISSVSLDIEDYFEEKTILDNQVVNVKSVPLQFYLDRARQKSIGVAKRVNEMINNVSLKEEEEILSPELVIVSQPVVIQDEVKEEEEIISSNENEEDSFEKEEKEDDVFNSVNDSDIFMTVEPFVEMPLFAERVDGSLKIDTSDGVDEFSFEKLEEVSDEKVSDLELEYTEELEDKKNNNLQLEYSNDLEEKMPDAFWITQEDKKIDNNDVIPSFDDQVSALLADDNDVKIKKLVA